MSEKNFPYFAEAILDDGTAYALDLEERGWANKELLKRTVRWTLADKQTSMSIVAVQIPEGGKPVFKSRWMGVIRDGSPTEDGFRCFAIGYKKGRTTYWVWVLPGGVVEVGEDPALADALWRARFAPETN